MLQVITRLALGGAERVALDLVHGMRGGFDFAVCAVNGVDPGELGQAMKRELDETGVALYTGTGTPIKFGGLALAAIRHARAVVRFDPHIIHLHTEIPEASYAAATAMDGRIASVPVVRTIHNSVYWESWRRLGLWCDRRMADSYVACVSNAARDAFRDLRAESGATGARRSPAVIYNGVDVEGCRHAERRPSHSPVRILYAGRFEEQKGVDLLPEIVRRVRLPETTRCRLEIYGSGTYEAALRRFALAPPEGWTISVDDPVADIKGRLSDFDLLIMPSRYEGLGIMAIEAAKLGLPAIVTNAPGLREAFPDGYAFAAEAGNAESFAERLTHALSEPDALHRAAGQARLFAERRFDAPGMCEAYADIYHHILKAVVAGGPSRIGGFVRTP